MEVLPGLTVVAVQTAAAARRAAVEARHGVAVGGGPVTVMLAAPAAVPVGQSEMSLVLGDLYI